MNDEVQLPRELTEQERQLLLWLLPDDRPGYVAYRQLLDRWKVIAESRRGEGNYILGESGNPADNESPLPQLLACGVVQTADGAISVSLRERTGNQVEYEIVNLHSETVPERLREIRRWTLSSWLPGERCPACGTAVREVAMKTERGRALVLAICAGDRRLWVYDEASGINHPIPVTNLYNELMLHKNVRDPAVALDSRRLFTDVASFTDIDLTRAFVTYNKLRTKVALDQPILEPSERTSSWLKRMAKLFSKAGGDDRARESAHEDSYRSWSKR